MQKFIYFHRHGETHYTMRRMGYGNQQYQAMLTKRGIQEMELLGQELAKRGPFDLYLTSPMPRAVQSATIVHRHLGEVEFMGEPALTDMINEISQEVWERVTKLAKQLVEGQHQKIILSTHGYVFYCLTAFFRGVELKELTDYKNPPTGAFGWVEIEDGKPIRACREVTTHLAPLNEASSLVSV